MIFFAPFAASREKNSPPSNADPKPSCLQQPMLQQSLHIPPPIGNQNHTSKTETLPVFT